MTNTLKQNPQTKDSKTDLSNALSVSDALGKVLSDTYRLVLKSHVYHWNVTGPLFVSVHDITEQQYTDMFAAADVLAERIRALGKPALISPAGLAAGPDGQDLNAGLSAEEMVKDLLSDHEALAESMRALVETAESAQDPVTADLATERAGFHEQAAWMLRAIAS
ncbi:MULTISPECIES: Dps family protein [unclassified Meridianimarinicoccus]|uniref:Dps family protein n=1 Tax=unclassified Meridianimarinicoccus TaxID=2923344 RepID=UPI001867F71C|nr:DNA starvation/stationary phase protection protein [Fluviibacterium sp. MJW13]